MKITIDTNNLSDLVHSLFGEIPNERGRSAALIYSTNALAEELEKSRARVRDLDVSLTQSEGEAERAHRACRALNKQLGEVVCERDQALTDLHWAKDELDELRHLRRNFEDMSIRLERELNEARARHQKALEQNMRFEAELVVLASEKTHACSEWRRAVAEEAYLRGEYDKLKEKLPSTSST